MPVNVNGIPCTLAGGVRETTQTTGTGTYSLDGAATVSGITYRTFVAGVGSGTVTVYTARVGSQFETGVGTVASGAPATITRSSILESSNGNNAVSWGAGVKDIMIDAPAALFHSLQASVDAGTFVNRVVSTVRTTTGTFTRDADCMFARVQIVAGGGAGGGTAITGPVSHAEGGGGGGGEYAEGWFTAAQIGTSQLVTIGAGGTGVSGANGNTGGTTSFGSLMTAIGGSGGVFGPSTPDNGQSDGGSGGTGGAGGSFRVRGSRGGMGTVRAALWQGTGTGGGSVLGGGVSSSGEVPVTGGLYGGGGSGNSESQSQAAGPGGAGAAGICIVIEFCKA